VVLGLCQAWNAAQQDPPGKAMTAEALRTLTATAGGEQHIAVFCAALLAEAQATNPPTPATTNATANPKAARQCRKRQ
jgi:hypothetical protein